MICLFETSTVNRDARSNHGPRLVRLISLFFLSGATRAMQIAMTDRLDRIDRNILAALSREGRLSMSALAERVGLSKTPVQARVRRLEAEGYIRGYAAIVDREKTGEGHIAFVQVKLDDTRSAALDAFNQAVLKVPEIEQCHMIAASFDYLLKVRTKDIAAYRRVLGERISALPHVAQTSTFVAMETVRDR